MNEHVQNARKALDETGPAANAETAQAELEKNLSPETLVSMQSALGLKQELKRSRKRRGTAGFMQAKSTGSRVIGTRARSGWRRRRRACSWA